MSVSTVTAIVPRPLAEGRVAFDHGYSSECQFYIGGQTALSVGIAYAIASRLLGYYAPAEFIPFEKPRHAVHVGPCASLRHGNCTSLKIYTDVPAHLRRPYHGTRPW